MVTYTCNLVLLQFMTYRGFQHIQLHVAYTLESLYHYGVGPSNSCDDNSLLVIIFKDGRTLGGKNTSIVMSHATTSHQLY